MCALQFIMPLAKALNGEAPRFPSSRKTCTRPASSGRSRVLAKSAKWGQKRPVSKRVSSSHERFHSEHNNSRRCNYHNVSSQPNPPY
jgi:hypothetical protein